jgi:hypothetical protein
MDKKTFLMSAIILILTIIAVVIIAVLINSNIETNAENRKALVGIQSCLAQHQDFTEYHRCAHAVLTERLSK